MLALLAATTEFAAAIPWELMADCDLVGLTDLKTGETRLAAVLGNGGEVFGAVFYRRPAGLHWILNALDSLETCMDLDVMEGMDLNFRSRTGEGKDSIPIRIFKII